MPIIAKASAAPGPVPVGGGIVAVLPAQDGLAVVVLAPAEMETREVPPGGRVVAWAQVADPGAAGGARVEPVFLAAGRAWTPDQYRAEYGARLIVQVGAAR